jgi:predicted Zn-dependent protease
MPARLLLGALILMLAGSAGAQKRELPDFGSPADSVFGKNKEAQVGRGVMLQLRSAGALLEDPELDEYIGTLGARLAGHVNDGEHDFEFFVVKDDSINAFALPGGHVGVNSGLILASDSESELAGVLAHEISHVTQHHIARAVYDNQRASIMSMAAMLAAMVLGAATNVQGDAMTGVLAASQAAAIQNQINFTRANEYEADRVGIEVLASAGFDPQAMASFFEKLGRRYGLSEQQMPALLQTHPVTTERIAEARGRARQLPPAKPIDSVSYRLAKARLRVLTAPTPQRALAYFEAQDHLSAADRYGMALALMSLGRSDEAERTFRALATESPEVIPYRIAQAEALMANGLTTAALEVYAAAIALFPRNVPLTISYTEALIASGHADEAHRLLLDLLNQPNIRPSPEQIRLIARAANAEGDVGNAYYYMAEYYISLGNLPLALGQLDMALESPDVNAVDRARFEARQAQLQEFRGGGARRERGDEPPPEPAPAPQQPERQAGSVPDA